MTSLERGATIQALEVDFPRIAGGDVVVLVQGGDGEVDPVPAVTLLGVETIRWLAAVGLTVMPVCVPVMPEVKVFLTGAEPNSS